jgi:hypothetical protein
MVVNGVGQANMEIADHGKAKIEGHGHGLQNSGVSIVLAEC